MIRTFAMDDLDRVMDIWLSSNIQAHSFIPHSYWQNHYEMVKELLPKVEVYVYEQEGQIVGFVGIDNGYVAGIFVSASMRSQGIGKELLEKCKCLYDHLSLNVYQKNTGAVTFYQRESFAIDAIKTDENTGEIEYGMVWSR